MENFFSSVFLQKFCCFSSKIYLCELMFMDDVSGLNILIYGYSVFPSWFIWKYYFHWIILATNWKLLTMHFVVVHSLSFVLLFATPWTAVHQAPVSLLFPGVCSEIHIHWVGESFSASESSPISQHMDIYFCTLYSVSMIYI